MEHRRILVMVYSSSPESSNLVDNAVARGWPLVGRQIWLVWDFRKKLVQPVLKIFDTAFKITDVHR